MAKSLKAISNTGIETMDAFDITLTPSVLYSLRQDGDDPRYYSIVMASRHIERLFLRQLTMAYADQYASLMESFFSFREVRGPGGILFEKILVNWFCKGSTVPCKKYKSMKFDGKQAAFAKEEDVIIPSLDCKYYSSEEDLKGIVANLKNPTLIKPYSKTSPQVDMIIFTGKEWWLLQVTVSDSHSFVPKHIKNLADVLKDVNTGESYPWKFVFCVPESVYLNFKPQTPQTIKRTKMVIDPHLDQYAWSIEQNSMMKLMRDLCYK